MSCSCPILFSVLCEFFNIWNNILEHTTALDFYTTLSPAVFLGLHDVVGSQMFSNTHLRSSQNSSTYSEIMDST